MVANRLLYPFRLTAHEVAACSIGQQLIANNSVYGTTNGKYFDIIPYIRRIMRMVQ